MLIFEGLIKKFILPKSKNIDDARREFILNILLVGSILLALVAFVRNAISYLTNSISLFATNAVPPYITLFFLIFCCFLLFLSRKGKIALAAFILILFLSLSSFYTSWRWGTDIPQSLLIYALVIIMCGILIGIRVTFIMTAIISGALIVLSTLQAYKIYIPSSNWRIEEATMRDTFVIVANLVVIALVSWLFNREMEKALVRARISEHALKKERDQLEIIVAERTQELKKVQVEKLMQLYRFAEFGRLSSGLFHELVTPLNIISLNLHQARKDSTHLEMKEKLDKSLERAMVGTERLEKFLRAAKKQIQTQDISQEFSLNEEIKNVIQMIEYKAKKEKIKIIFNATQQVLLFGNPLKLNQLITNLVINGIDAYDSVDKKDKRVEIVIKKKKNIVVISVQDWATGIDEKILPKIFDPLFTTKSFERGTGIGLSLCKEIVEKYFKGTIQVKSRKGVGTIFTISFALQKQAINRLIKQNKNN